MTTEITLEKVQKCLAIIDQGLVRGKGNPKPGQLCVEAAICLGLGLPHSDDPECVSRPLRALKIRLNDSDWSSNQARAKGLRRLGLAQLGSRGVLDDNEFVRRVVDLAIRKSVPIALRAAASIHPNPQHQAELEATAVRCEKDGDIAAARAAYAAANTAYAANAADAAANAADAAAYAADAAAWTARAAYAAANAADAAAYAARAAARDKTLADFAEDVVQVLIEMNAPGRQWLPLTEAAA